MVGVLNVNKGYKKVAMAGMAGLGATLGMLVLTGKLFAAFPLTGIGGFVISAPHIGGQQFSLVPSITGTDQQAGWPAALVSINTVNIDQGFELTKHFDLSATPIASEIPSADVNIVASNVQGTGLRLDTTGLQARDALFGSFDAHEGYSIVTSTVDQQHPYGVGFGSAYSNPNGTPLIDPVTKAAVNGSQDTLENGVVGSYKAGQIDPSQQLGLSAATLDLSDAAINTNALKSDSLNIGGLKLEIVANTKQGNVGGFKYDSGYESQSTKVDSATGDYNLPQAPMYNTDGTNGAPTGPGTPGQQAGSPTPTNPVGTAGAPSTPSGNN